LQFHPRINQAVKDIGHEIGNNDGHGGQKQQSLHQNKIPIADGDPEKIIGFGTIPEISRL
jgi:hypothetical protein